MFGAVGDALVVVALAEVPQTDLVEVVEPDGAGDTVDEDGIGDGEGNDVGEIDFEEVGFAEDGLVGEIADADEQEEDPGD